MLESIPYDEFQTSNGGLTIDHGPWFIWRSYRTDINCGSERPLWCNDVPSCLSAWVFPSASQSSYTVSFYTKLAFDLAPYRNYLLLGYEWEYLPWWGSSKSTVGMPLDISSSAGDNVFAETLHAGDWSQLFSTGEGWNYAPFKYKGTTNFTKNAAETMGYISLYINITFPRQEMEYINYYVKAASFKITSAPAPVTSGTSDSSSRPNKLSVGSFVGGIIGAAIFAALVIVALLFYMKKRRQKEANTRNQEMGEAGTNAVTNRPVVSDNANSPNPVSPFDGGNA
ncbi:hypothetical protein FRC15_002876 [Serendipita sp. 397]|nr:hypothetical protein FRC15_002876 [Serendipita sp. 397]